MQYRNWMVARGGYSIPGFILCDRSSLPQKGRTTLLVLGEKQSLIINPP